MPGGEVGTQRQLAFVDAGGNVNAWSSDRRAFLLRPNVSPDGHKIATIITNAQGIDEVWVSDIERPMLRRIVAVPDADCDWPIWSPDSHEIAFARTGRDSNDGIYVQDSEGRGSARRIVKPESSQVFYQLGSWAPDGSGILMDRFADGKGDIFFVALSPSSGPARPKPVIASSANELGATFSRDGRWISYVSNESGRNEVYVCSYQRDGTAEASTRVSNGGGGFPRWAPDGKKLYYQDDHNQMMSVTFNGSGSFSAPTRVPNVDLDKLRIDPSIDVLPDGRFFGILKQEEEKNEITGCNVILNWLDEFKRKGSKTK